MQLNTDKSYEPKTELHIERSSNGGTFLEKNVPFSDSTNKIALHIEPAPAKNTETDAIPDAVTVSQAVLHMKTSSHDGMDTSLEKLVDIDSNSSVNAEKDWRDYPSAIRLDMQRGSPLEITDISIWIGKKQWKNSFEDKISKFISEPLVLQQMESKLMIKNIKILMDRISKKVKKLNKHCHFLQSSQEV